MLTARISHSARSLTALVLVTTTSLTGCNDDTQKTGTQAPVVPAHEEAKTNMIEFMKKNQGKLPPPPAPGAVSPPASK